MAFLSLLTIALSAGSCKKNEVAKEAKVDLSIIATSTSSVTFELIAEEAVKVSYCIFRSNDIPSSEYIDIEKPGSEPLRITINDLEENTEYTVSANATNKDGKTCQDVTALVTTTVKSSVDIEIKRWTSSGVTFSLNPVNAISCSYAVVKSDSDVENVDLTESVEIPLEKELVVNGLDEDTKYTIVAAAFNSSGEISERAYQSFRTEKEPFVDIKDIIIEGNQINVKILLENAVSYAYYVVKKNEEYPGLEEFKKIDAPAGENSFLVSNLDYMQDYVLLVCGMTSNDYAGKLVEKEFKTGEKVIRSFDISIEKIQSNDAIIDINIDNGIYSEYYVVLGKQKDIGNPEEYDWIANIESEYTFPILKQFRENVTFNLREYDESRGISPEQLYMIGGIPRKQDGSLDSEAVIWRPIQLKEVVIGESPFSCELEIIGTGYDAVKYRVKTDSEEVERFYMGYFDRHGVVLDEIVESILGKKPLVTFNEDLYLKSAYANITMAVIGVDNEGRLTNAISREITFKDLDYHGDFDADVEVVSSSRTSIVFDVEIPDDINRIAYHFVPEDKYDEQTFIKNLKCLNNKIIQESGEFLVDGLLPETKYVFAFMPISELEEPGNVKMINVSTEGLVFDGDERANVSVNITQVTDRGTGSYKIQGSLIANEYVSKYYMTAKSDSNPDLTYATFVERVGKGWFKECTGESQITGFGGGMSIGSNGYIWILPYDNEGKMCKIIEYKVEETWK